MHTEPLYRKNGGHGVIFKDETDLYLVLHAPNDLRSAERPALTKIKELEDGKGYALF